MDLARLKSKRPDLFNEIRELGRKQALEAGPAEVDAKTLDRARRDERNKLLEIVKATVGVSGDYLRFERAVRSGVTPEQMTKVLEYVGKTPSRSSNPESRTGRRMLSAIQRDLGIKQRDRKGFIMEANFQASFESKVQELRDKGLSMQESLKQAAARFPEAHRDYLERANSGQPVRRIY